MGACTPMRVHRVRRHACARRRPTRLRRACGAGVSVACHARNPPAGRCMRIGRQSFAGSSARIGRLRSFLVHFGRSPRFSLTSRALLSRLFAAACLFRPPFSRDSSPFVCASSRFRRPLSPNR
ncbi:hypothetical protein C6P96_24615 [Burkholderia multivorans]|nr:hypothetical protein C6P95_23050 [Burkholderia multivorans]PRF07714.1 hypothetical protein C6P96_24615 [Burkholderia multivorans]